MARALLLLLAACAASSGDPVAAPTSEPGDDPGPSTPEPPDPPRADPTPPAGLQRWLVGDPADVAPADPRARVLVGGGGGDVDVAMSAWLEAAAGGDVVVLRTSGEDGYNAWLHETLGGVDSVETLRVDTPALADDPYVAWRVATAEAVFMAGGDQWTYLDRWGGTAMHDALVAAWAEGRAVGGTSAGAAVLGARAFSAEQDTIDSAAALADPYDPALTFVDGFLALPVLDGVVVDTHFYERDRFGRLLVFLARMLADGAAPPVVGVGVDEDTAVVVDADGVARVAGDGYAYVITATSAPTVCAPGEPLSLAGWTYRVVHPGDALRLPEGTGDGPVYPIDVREGRMDPARPY